MNRGCAQFAINRELINQINPFVPNNPNILEQNKNDVYNKDHITEKESEFINKKNIYNQININT